ncbi:hypothetical protein AH580_19440 [Salmonella enterica subsp. enterica serovar Montevideo]|nr:hypothetical protein [Salmonella enterica subsp. enterica serovar Montevideo]EEK7292546.1 hypothetical protein [Salmonella enterica subsp. enterica serovar Montevideo]
MAFCGANQHDHGLCALVCSSAAAPHFGAMWLCCSLVFSFVPSMPCRASCECNYMCLMFFYFKSGVKSTCK